MKTYTTLIIITLLLISCKILRVKEDFYFYNNSYHNHPLLRYDGVYVNEQTWTTFRRGSQIADSIYTRKIYKRFFRNGLLLSSMHINDLTKKLSKRGWKFYHIEGDTIYEEVYTNYLHGYFVIRGLISKDRIDFKDRIQYNYPRRKNIKPDFYQDFSKNNRINLEDEPRKVFKFMEIKGIEKIQIKDIDSLTFR